MKREEAKRIYYDFLKNCTGYQKHTRGYQFCINGSYIGMKKHPSTSKLSHIGGMSSLILRAFEEKWDEERFVDAVNRLRFKGKEGKAESKNESAQKRKEHGGDVTADIVANVEQPKLSIDEELHEAVKGYGKMASQILDDISPVLKRIQASRDEENVKRLARENFEYANKLAEISDYFYKEIFKYRSVIEFSGKFLNPFQGQKPIAEILNFYGVPENENRAVARQFNEGLLRSGIAYKIKNGNTSEWRITAHAISIARGTSSSICPGEITTDKLIKLSESCGSELYYNYAAFCCCLDRMRMDGTVNFDVMKSIGIWK